MDLLNYNKAPNAEFLFGTDTMGRDIFSMIWYGGRISILIGGLATVISTFIAVVVGAFSGVAPAWLDEMIKMCIRDRKQHWYTEAEIIPESTRPWTNMTRSIF